MGITETIAAIAVQFIENTGYLSVFILMTMESMIFPVPSEAVMPFAGWLIASGVFSWPLVILISTLGSIAGSLLSYLAGYFGGKPFVHRFGKYFFLNEHHLEATHRFFERHGSWAVLVCRFIPIVRHLSSIPAGIAKMNLWVFSAFTILGAGLWNAFLALMGTILQKNWEKIMEFSKLIDIAVVLVLVALVALFLVRQFKKSRASSPAGK